MFHNGEVALTQLGHGVELFPVQDVHLGLETFLEQQIAPIQYGKSAQRLAPEDNTVLLNKPRTTHFQQIPAALLWYARMIDNTMLKALNTITRKQSATTELTEQWADHILDYCATNPTATVTFKASDMQLKVYSDASYLNEPNTRSSFVGYSFLGWNQADNEPMRLNGCLGGNIRRICPLPWLFC